MPSSRRILCHPLLLPPLIFPSIRVFSSESAFHIKWPKYWSFSFSISPSSGIQSTDSFKFGQMLNGLDIHSCSPPLPILKQSSPFFNKEPFLGLAIVFVSLTDSESKEAPGQVCPLFLFLRQTQLGHSQQEHPSHAPLSAAH